jgi:hypothetical protein
VTSPVFVFVFTNRGLTFATTGALFTICWSHAFAGILVVALLLSED